MTSDSTRVCSSFTMLFIGVSLIAITGCREATPADDTTDTSTSTDNSTSSDTEIGSDTEADTSSDTETFNDTDTGSDTSVGACVPGPENGVCRSCESLEGELSYEERIAINVAYESFLNFGTLTADYDYIIAYPCTDGRKYMQISGMDTVMTYYFDANGRVIGSEFWNDGVYFCNADGGTHPTIGETFQCTARCVDYATLFAFPAAGLPTCRSLLGDDDVDTDTDMVAFGPEHTVVEDLDGADRIATADLDSDGFSDILASAYYTGESAWWKNPGGAGIWIQQALPVDFNWLQTVTMDLEADLDGDDDLDIFRCGATPGNGYVASASLDWWENDGGDATAFTSHSIDPAFRCSSAQLVDMDGDGDVDIVGASMEDDQIAWWVNGGDGLSWVRNDLSIDLNAVSAIVVADVDGDGDNDIVASAYLSDDVSWYENEDGLGTSWTARKIIGNFDGALSVVAQDFDNDGDIDIAATGYWEDAIRWWENTL